MQLKLNSLLKKVNKEKYEKYLEYVPDFKEAKTQKFTTIVFTLIAFIILLIFAINPTLSTIAKLHKQVEDAKTFNEKLDQKVNSLSILQTKYNNLQSDLPVIYSAVPKKAEATLLMGQIQSLINQANLSLVSLQVLDVVTSETDDFSSYTFDVSARGEYENMLSFLENITSMQRIIALSNVTIKRQTENNNDILQINIRGSALFKK